MDSKTALRGQLAELGEGAWVKSSRSGPYSDNCVEVADLNGGKAVRDSKDRGTGLALVFDDDEWAAFCAGVKLGEF